MTATADADQYPVGPEGQEVPWHYDLRVYQEDGALTLSLHRLRTGGPADDGPAPADAVCRRYVTTNLGEEALGWRKRNCPEEDWADTWCEVHRGTVEQIAATVAAQETHLAPYQQWMATNAAEMIEEVEK